MNLYWVETEDHHEDWFVMAEDKRQAEEFFADYEGYELDYPTARLVCPLREGDHKVTHPSDDLLRSIGADVETIDGARAVKLLGEIFHEGGLQATIDVINSAGFSPLDEKGADE